MIQKKQEGLTKLIYKLILEIMKYLLNLKTKIKEQIMVKKNLIGILLIYGFGL